MRRLVSLLAAAILLYVAPAAAGAVWVAPPPRGDDAACATTRWCATVGRAFEVVEDGGVIYGQPGVYPEVKVTRKFIKQTYIRSVTIEGHVLVEGARNVKFYNSVIRGSTVVRGGADGVTFSATRHSAPASNCIDIRGGARNVLFMGVTVEDCGRAGFNGTALAEATPVDGVTVQDSTIRDIEQDAMQFGNWNNVRLLRNTISDVRDSRAATGTCPGGPSGCIHNDGIQTTGKVHGLLVDGNKISGVRGQGILLQPAYGPQSNVTIRANRILGHPTAYVPLQAYGIAGLTIEANTVCGSPAGAIWVGGGNGATLTIVDNHSTRAWQQRSSPLTVLTDRGNTVGACPIT